MRTVATRPDQMTKTVQQQYKCGARAVHLFTRIPKIFLNSIVLLFALFTRKDSVHSAVALVAQLGKRFRKQPLVFVHYFEQSPRHFPIRFPHASFWTWEGSFFSASNLWRYLT